MLSWPRSRWRAPRSPRRTARTAGGDVSLLQHRVWSPQHYVGRFQGAFPAAPPDSLRGDRNGADMQRWRGYDAVPAGWGRSVVTIGVFDGVHRGHQQIIGHAVKRAGDLGLRSVVVASVHHPSEVVRPGSDAAVPADGVYAAWLVRDVQRLPAAVSIGTNPTFSGRERRVEAYVLDFDDDLYGERVALDFVERLRDMQRYSGVEPLIAQIREDIVRTREVLSL